MKTHKIIDTPTNEIVFNYKTGEECSLVSNDNPSKISETDLIKITEICNQPSIYNFLFKFRLEGRPYTIDDAKGFVEWIAEGWKNQQWFVFLIRNNQNEIIGAIDIKSNNLDSAEIGYWADGNYSGIMTNAVKKIIEIAALAGYKSLYATTMPNNDRSQNVLTRNSFIRNGEMEKPNGMRFLFTRNL